MTLIPRKLFKRDYLQMLAKDRLPFLRGGTATIGGHRVQYPYWPYFYGLFYEIFVEDNYRIDGLKNVKRIIDAGSNIGVSALYFAQTYPDAHIDCFEPNPEAISFLKQNMQAFKNVAVHQYALGNTEGTLEFFVDADIRASSIASAANLLISKNRPSRPISVNMKRLSSFIDEPIDILKLDIEGGEMAVLEDLVQTGAIHKVQNLLLEFHYVPDLVPASLARLLTLLEGEGFFSYIRRGAMLTKPAAIGHAYMMFSFRPEKT